MTNFPSYMLKIKAIPRSAFFNLFSKIDKKLQAGKVFFGPKTAIIRLKIKNSKIC